MQTGDALDSNADVLEFTGSELFRKLFGEGIDLVEETAAYLDGDGRSESRLLSRSAGLAYAGESMKLTTRLMQIASWLLAQRAVHEGNLDPAAIFESRYRLAPRALAGHDVQDMPASLLDYVERAKRLYVRVYYLDQKMYARVDNAPAQNGIMDQMERLRAAFG